VTFYLSNTQVRPVGYEAGEFLDVDREPQLLRETSSLPKCANARWHRRTALLTPGDAGRGDVVE
jgi:hypothetical protein